MMSIVAAKTFSGTCGRPCQIQYESLLNCFLYLSPCLDFVSYVDLNSQSAGFFSRVTLRNACLGGLDRKVLYHRTAMPLCMATHSRRAAIMILHCLLTHKHPLHPILLTALGHPSALFGYPSIGISTL